MLRNWTVAATVVVLAAALVVGSQQTGESAAPTAPAAPTTALAPLRPAASCKPTVPLDIDLQALGAGRWRLRCSSQDQDRDVTVWMWSGSVGTRRQVWRGRLLQSDSRVLEVDFTPTDAASRVWAAIEVFGPHGDGMRRLASVSPRGEPLAGVADAGAQLLQDPATGERILQFTGQTEAGR
jgi:hypothetical protein